MQLRFVHKQRYAWVKYLVRTEGFMLAKPKKKSLQKFTKFMDETRVFSIFKEKIREYLI